MRGHVFIFFLTSILFLFYGCGSLENQNDNQKESADTTTIEYMLEHSNYKGVIDQLLTKATTNEEYMQLAEAYLGMAGSSPDKMKSFIISLEGDKLDGLFAKYFESVERDLDLSQNLLVYFGEAIKYYNLVIDNDGCSNGEACLNKGLSLMMQAAISIGFIKGYDDKDSSVKLTTLKCADLYAFNGADGGCSILDKDPLTFTENKITYERITVFSDGIEQQYLLRESPLPTKEMEVMTTKGYCTLDDFSTRVFSKNDPSFDKDTYYVCPIELSLKEGGTKVAASDYTADKLLIGAFNDAIKTITSDLVSDEMIKEIMVNFLKDLLGIRSLEDGEQEINMEDMIEYLKIQL